MLDMPTKSATKSPAKTDVEDKARTMTQTPDITGPNKPALLSVEDAKSMSLEKITDLFKTHLNPGQYHFMKLLGFHKVKIETA